MVSEERKLTKEEYKRLLHAAKEKNERLYLVMQSICSVGLRVSELKFLTVEAVHRGRTVVNNKGKMRTVVLPPKPVSYTHLDVFTGDGPYSGRRPARIVFWDLHSYSGIRIKGGAFVKRMAAAGRNAQCPDFFRPRIFCGNDYRVALRHE